MSGGPNRRDVLVGIVSAAAVGVPGCGENESVARDPQETNGTPGGSPTTENTTATSQTAPPTTTNDTAEATDSPTATPETVQGVVGERVDVGSLAALVTETTRSTDLRGRLPAEGREYVTVSLRVKNTSSASLDFESYLQVSVVDPDGRTHEPSGIAPEPVLDGGHLVPGEVTAGNLSFVVPAAAEELSLLMQTDPVPLVRGPAARVDLSSPAAADGTLAQDLAVPVRSPGETARAGGVGVTPAAVETAGSLGDGVAATDGHEFVVLDLTVENGESGPTHVHALVASAAKDDDGATYEERFRAMGALENPFSQGPSIEDGSERSGGVVYEVPSGSSPVYFAFDFSAFAAGDKAFWRLR